ncbi:uncharacterized protein LOC124945269 [Impatiens glandulifera]|uniref:uncharacterized protein LOC124945269 n=1 Tax=Impatiens glandulifera TaxID=253017 RepID=UPI001FB08146|nr:uncharacterized protein LOC124945269 [Impatiens glandulifera]
MAELNPRTSSVSEGFDKVDENSEIRNLELESLNPVVVVGRSEHLLHSMDALDILRETVRILRFNSIGFMSIMALFICPVSAVILSEFLVDRSKVKNLSISLFTLAKTSGLPTSLFIQQTCQKLAVMIISWVACFPLNITVSLLSKAAVVYSVDCTYSRKKFDWSMFYSTISNLWKTILSTYIWTCMVISGCLVSFIVLFLAAGTSLSVAGFGSGFIIFVALVMGIVFCIVLAMAIVICSMAIVVSVLEEEVSGSQALIESRRVIEGKIRVGVSLFLISTIGMLLIEWLFDHRVKTVSYGDGSSRIWEGPLLVLMYSFVLLIDYMNWAVFYFCCKSPSSLNGGEIGLEEVDEI